MSKSTPMLVAAMLAALTFGMARTTPGDPAPRVDAPAAAVPGVAVWSAQLLERLRRTPSPLSIDGVRLDDRMTVTLELEEVPQPELPRVEIAQRFADGSIRTRLGDASTLRILRGVAVDDQGARHRAWIAVGDRVLGGLVRLPASDRFISSGPHRAGLPAVAFDPSAVPPSFLPTGTGFCTAPPQDGAPEADFGTDGTDGDQGGLAGFVEGNCREVDIAVETDLEFTENLFGGDLLAATEYALALMGASSEIFLLDVETRLRVEFVRLWVGDDPWNQSGMGDQLVQFRDHWQAQMGDVQRDLAAFLSGRGLGGGVAWLPGLCNAYGYSLSANLNGSFPYPIQDHSGQNWDLMVNTHELGHNHGAPHTHSQSPPIDGCGNGDCSNAYGGTIMSYCHTCSGGLSNVVMRFHPGSVASMKLTFDAVSCDYSGESTPAAAIDDALFAVDGETSLLDPLLNDRDANCQAIELLSYDATTIGGRVVIVETGPAGETLLGIDGSGSGPETDEFSYEIIDSDGTTATGTVLVSVTSVRASVPVAGDEPGALASYFDIPQSSALPDFEALEAYATSISENVDYPSTGGAFADSGRADFVAATFEGWIDVPASGIWRLFTDSDDGSRLFVGDELVVDNDGLHGMVERSGEIGLAEGRHPIRVEFFENAGGAGLIVRWSGPGLAKQVIPPAAWSYGGIVVDPDIDGDGVVGGTDLAAVLAYWGPCDQCPADLDGDGLVGGTEITIVLGAWTQTP